MAFGHYIISGASREILEARAAVGRAVLRGIMEAGRASMIGRTLATRPSLRENLEIAFAPGIEFFRFAHRRLLYLSTLLVMYF